MLVAIMTLAVSGGYAAAEGNDAGASPAEELKRESAEALDALADFSAEQKDEAASTAQKLVARLDQRIRALRQNLDNNWDAMDQAGRQHQKAMIESLARQRDALEDQLSGLSERSGAAWEELKAGFVRSYRALQGSEGDKTATDAAENQGDNSD